MDDAAIDQFREQLVDASQFLSPATAVAGRTAMLLDASAGGRFDEWLMLVLSALVVQVSDDESAGRTAAAIVQSDHACRSYEQGEAENGQLFMRRLTLHAREVDRPWLVIALRDAAGVLWWYAEARGRGVAVARVGRMGSNSDTDAWTGEPIHPTNANWLGRILLGHPARRRFPLRPA